LRLVKHSEIMNLREEEIGRKIELLSKQTKGFDDPKMVLIGGYALGDFTSFSDIQEIATLFLGNRMAGIWKRYKICSLRT
jgi:hypothetical protein